jgi:hypothetical protein
VGAGAAGGSSGAEATASAVSASKFKKLKQQVQALQQKVDQLQTQSGPAGPPGPQGPEGPQGAQGVAPACQGNDASDVMVSAGAVCIDKYEASVWSSPTGGTQFGVNADDYPCNDNGQDCKGKIFARSVAGVTPSGFITWFQAQQALANSGKRLPSNAEWQQAVAGTPEGQCNRSDGVVQATGIFSDCVSDWGAFDMVGNVGEWVADWGEEAGGCANWPAAYGSDLSCIGRADTQSSTRLPGALIRGGFFMAGASAGPFSVNAVNEPLGAGASTLGFRGVR